MDREAIEIWIGKKIKVNLRSGVFYTGFISKMYATSMVFTDKYNLPIGINYDSISLIKEVMI